MKRLLLAVSALFFVPMLMGVVTVAPPTSTNSLLAAEVMAVDATATASTTVNHWGSRGGYLVVTTSSEVADATLTMSIDSGGVTDICDALPTSLTVASTGVTNISTQAVTFVAPINSVCLADLISPTTFNFTVTGAGSSGFTVTADMHWHQN